MRLIAANADTFGNIEMTIQGDLGTVDHRDGPSGSFITHNNPSVYTDSFID